MDGSGSSCAGAGLLPEVRGDPDMQAPLVSGWGGVGGVPLSGRRDTGPRAECWLGPVRSPRPVLYFFCSFFYFSCFTNSFISFA
jgi:hypothetical protein